MLLYVDAKSQTIANDNFHKQSKVEHLNSSGIKWVEGLTWKQVKEKAKSENKYIFVDCYATWCAPCKKMDKDVYTDSKVGEILNKSFFSIKVQMDVTSKDNEETKAWYADARYINREYKPEAYPCFLFFSPGGKLIHRDFGIKNPDGFINLILEAMSDPIGKYENELYQFKNEKLDYADMSRLARQVRKNKDNELALRIARKYKVDYLDRQPFEKAFSKENLKFIAEFYYYLINSKDRYFHFIYNNSQYADSLIDIENVNKISELIITGIITKEEITDMLYIDNKPLKITPNWKKISASITSKYDSYYSNKIIPNQQINYYRAVGNWKRYVLCVDKKIKHYPPSPGGKLFGEVFGDAWHLNSHAWAIFKNCNRKKLLRKALNWVNLSLQLVTDSPRSSFIDTKANILYKLGKVREAIVLEQAAVDLDHTKHHEETLEKMKKGEPTWTIK